MRACQRLRGRGGVAAMEFAVCLPVIVLLLFGIWEVGRMTEVQAVMVNAAREGSRQASTGEDAIAVITQSIYVYLQQAEPTALPSGGIVDPSNKASDASGAVSQKVTLGNAAGKELFTLTFWNQTDSSRNDPTTASQMDKFQVTVSLPFDNVKWHGTAVHVDPTTKTVTTDPNAYNITGVQRLSATVAWYSMRDTPIVISTALPVQ